MAQQSGNPEDRLFDRLHDIAEKNSIIEESSRQSDLLVLNAAKLLWPMENPTPKINRFRGRGQMMNRKGIVVEPKATANGTIEIKGRLK